MKQRLDILLTGQIPGLSREKAKALIMEGKVFVDGEREDKPGCQVSEEQANKIDIHGEVQRYVSRGGYKLGKALPAFSIDLSGKTCMDIGASTGGFTDYLPGNFARIPAWSVWKRLIFAISPRRISRIPLILLLVTCLLFH